MSATIASRVADAVTGGRPKEALDLVAAERPPIEPGLAPLVAEALAATAHDRRGAALLLLAARRHPGDRTLALEAARALLRRGRHRQASRVLAPHAATAPVLVAVAARQPVGALPPGDVQDEIDHALATPTSTAALTALLERAPASVRLRVAVAARALDEDRGAEARAILRAGLKGHDDARLEVALATVAVASGTWDEAAVVIARARSRFPRLARDPALQALLGLVTLQAGRRDDALSLLGGVRTPITTALHALLSAPTPTRPAAPAPTSSAAAAPARPMSALMQETLARAGAVPPPGSAPIGGPMPGSGGHAAPTPTTSPGATPAAGAPSPAPAAPTPVMSPAPATSPAPSPMTSPMTSAPPPPAPPPPKAATSASTTKPAPAAKAAPAATAPSGPLDPSQPAPPRTFRRLDAQPEPTGNRSAALIAIAALVAVVVIGPRIWRAISAPPPPAAATGTAFAQKLGRCGLDVEPWLDVDVAPSSLATAADSAGWRGGPATIPPDGLPLDAALQPGVTVLPLRTGAILEPALVVTPALDRVLGLAFTTSSERPLVSSLFGALKFDSATSRTCQGGDCVVGLARCEDLAIRVLAVCPGQTTASLLSRCAIDAAVIGPTALLPPPAAPVTAAPVASSLSGTDLVVPVSEP